MPGEMELLMDTSRGAANKTSTFDKMRAAFRHVHLLHRLRLPALDQYEAPY